MKHTDRRPDRQQRHRRDTNKNHWATTREDGSIALLFLIASIIAFTYTFVSNQRIHNVGRRSRESLCSALLRDIRYRCKQLGVALCECLFAPVGGLDLTGFVSGRRESPLGMQLDLGMSHNVKFSDHFAVSPVNADF